MAALPALLMSGDLQAGLDAFLAGGIIMLGFLICGRRWWGPLLVIGSVVMLTLLLAPEAYVAIGLAFALALLPCQARSLFAAAALSQPACVTPMSYRFP
jgi:hypothetical protein